jgi:hypothetical protein
MLDRSKRPGRRDREEITRQFQRFVNTEDEDGFWKWVNETYRPEMESERQTFAEAWADARRVREAAGREKIRQRLPSSHPQRS